MIAKNKLMKKIRRNIQFSIFLALFGLIQNVAAQIKEIPLQDQSCNVDYQTTINSINNNCLRLVTTDTLSNPEELIIYLHGDYGVGGASYMSTLGAQFKNPSRLNVALIRPGYFDDEGNFSTGNNLGVTTTNISGRLDNYTLENIDIIGNAIINLKNHYKPKRLILIGHSGGAAIAALILNNYPQLANGALLINCPCDVRQFRPDWKKSLSPIQHVSQVSNTAVIHVLSGALDDVVMPEMGKLYAQQLNQKGIPAKFYLGLGMGHNLKDKESALVLESMKSLQEELNKATP